MKFSLSRLFFPNQFCGRYLIKKSEANGLEWNNLDELWIGKKIQIDGIGASAYAFDYEHLYLRVRNMFFMTDIFRLPLVEVSRLRSESSSYPEFQFSIKGKPDVYLALGFSEDIRSRVERAYEEIRGEIL